eukprot:TRINITY_DN10821_c0_g1_i1.p1 TRINITY_DN10821_c0_g1~~TRINITY_DN10821_c0_g1_i1.p1  ORF type:complete len:235 (+),score=41.59 TRINITY_DN10821_c0_g1_i1:49-753(+)
MDKFPIPFVFVLLLALAPATLADAPRTAAVFLPARATALERALAHGAIAALGLRGSATGDAASSEELLLQGTATSPVLHAVVVESVCARAPARGGVLGETEGDALTLGTARAIAAFASRGGRVTRVPCPAGDHAESGSSRVESGSSHVERGSSHAERGSSDTHAAPQSLARDAAGAHHLRALQDTAGTGPCKSTGVANGIVIGATSGAFILGGILGVVFGMRKSPKLEAQEGRL